MMSEMKTFKQLSTMEQALIKSHGADDGVYVRAGLVKALNGQGNAAIFLADLLWWSRNKADEGGWFFRTREKIQERTGLGKSAQQTAREYLKDLGIIEETKRGMPYRLYYRIDFSELIERLLKAETQDVGLPRQQDGGVACQQDGVQESQPVGGGGTPAHNKDTLKDTDKDAERARPREETEPDPKEKGEPRSVTMYRKTFPDYSPTCMQVDRIQQIVCEDRLNIWDNVLDRWRLNDYNPNNLSDMLDAYEEAVQESSGSRLDRFETWGVGT